MSEEVDRWIKYMKENPKTWKRLHTKFIDAQFIKSKKFIKNLLKEPNGKQRVIDAYKIRNIEGYKELLS